MCPYFLQVVKVPSYLDLHEIIFHLLLEFLVFVFCSFGQISPKSYHGYSQQLRYYINRIICLLESLQWFGILQVILIEYD